MNTLRNQYLKESKRVVIKVGSRLLVDMERMDLNRRFMQQLVKSITAIRSTGREVVLVSSGAVGAGMASLGLKVKPDDMGKVQACASIGQIELSHMYQNLFKRDNIKIGQILLSAEDFRIRSRYNNINNTIEALLAEDCVPLINENDSVAIEEIKVGDNDKLSADVTHFLNADLLIIFTDENGLYDANPKDDPGAKLIPVVAKVTKNILKMASGKGSEISTGGMQTKLQAIKQATDAGCASILANGFEVNAFKLLEGVEAGTFFLPSTEHTSQRKRWIGLVSTTTSAIVLDNGAIKAIKAGRSSVLLVGVKETVGEFASGDLVNIQSVQGTIIARGIVSYRSDEISDLAGLKEPEINKWIEEHAGSQGKKNPSICIHRNDLYLT